MTVTCQWVKRAPWERRASRGHPANDWECHVGSRSTMGSAMQVTVERHPVASDTHVILV